MRTLASGIVGACLAVVGVSSLVPTSAAAVRPVARAERAARPAPLAPLVYEPNVGQCADGVRFAARGAGFALAVVDDGAVMALRGEPCARLTMRIEGARAEPRWEEGPAAGGRRNYFLGDDPSRWHTGVTAFRSVLAHGVLPGVDVAYASDGGSPEYRFLAAPGADVAEIGLAFDGAGAMREDDRGDLVIETPAGIVRHTRPVAWQETGSGRRRVDARFETPSPGRARIVVGAHDPSLPLVVDPRIEFSTYLGGTGAESLKSVAVGADGSCVVTGLTQSLDFPLRAALQPTYGNGSYDACVTKFDATGTGLVFSTYFGGNGIDDCRKVVLRGGSLWIAGHTQSTNFPSLGAFRMSSSSVPDLFVVRMSRDGSTLQYATKFGGSGADYYGGFDVNADGEFAVAFYTQSTDLPVANAWQTTNSAGVFDGAVAKLNAAGSAVVFCSYLGTTAWDQATALAFDADGSLVVGGFTTSTSWPVSNAAQSSSGGGQDGFLVRFGGDGGSPLSSTYVGGSGTEWVLGAAFTPAGELVLAGQTQSADFPVVSPLQQTIGGGTDTFVMRYAPSLTTVQFATWLGGSGGETPYGVAVSGSGRIWVVGQTDSTNYPLVKPFSNSLGGTKDAFVSRIAADGASLEFSTYLGGDGSADTAYGVALDGDLATIAGQTNSTDFPTVSPYQSSRLSASTNATGMVFRVGGQPTEPRQLTALLASVNDVDLHWIDDSTDEDGFRIERRAGSGAWLRLASVPAGTVSFRDDDLAFDTSFTYRVFAFNGDGESRPSNEATVRTLPMLALAPVSVAAGPIAGGKVHVAWSGAFLFATGFEIERSCDGGPFETVGTTDGGARSLDDVVAPDADCVYRVRTLNEFGASDPQQTTARSRSSLTVRSAKGLVSDSAKPHRDSFRVSGALALDPAASPDGVASAPADGFEVRLGSWSEPVLLSVAAGDPRWKVRRGAATWTSARGDTPKLKVTVDLRRGVFSAEMAGFDLDTLPAPSIRVCVAVGNDRGSETLAWKEIRDGTALRLGR